MTLPRCPPGCSPDLPRAASHRPGPRVCTEIIRNILKTQFRYFSTTRHHQTYKIAPCTGRVSANVSVVYNLQWVEMTLHRLAAISHVAQLVDVEPVIARRQARDLTRHLHRRRGAARLQIFLDATLNIFLPVTCVNVTCPEMPSPATTATATCTRLAWHGGKMKIMENMRSAKS